MKGVNKKFVNTKMIPPANPIVSTIIPASNYYSKIYWNKLFFKFYLSKFYYRRPIYKMVVGS